MTGCLASPYVTELGACPGNLNKHWYSTFYKVTKPAVNNMATFNITDFFTDFEKSPVESKLNALKRSQFFDLAKYYEVSVMSSMKKADLKAVLVEFFVDEGLLKSIYFFLSFSYSFFFIMQNNRINIMKL